MLQLGPLALTSPRLTPWAEKLYRTLAGEAVTVFGYVVPTSATAFDPARDISRAGMTLPPGQTPATEIDLEPLIREIESIGLQLRESQPSRILLFNDESHEFTDVVRIVMLATGYSAERSFRITLQAHTDGCAVAYEGPEDACQRVASVFERAALIWRLE